MSSKLPFGRKRHRWNGKFPDPLQSMSLERAIEYRFEARKCFEQAERAPIKTVKARMKEIAEAWLKMAANAEAEIGAPRHD